MSQMRPRGPEEFDPEDEQPPVDADDA